MMVFNRNLLFQGFIFRFHVSFTGCKLDDFFSEGSFSTMNFPSRDFARGKHRPIPRRQSQVDIHLMNPGFPDPMVEMALFFSEDANLLGKHF